MKTKNKMVNAIIGILIIGQTACANGGDGNSSNSQSVGLDMSPFMFKPENCDSDGMRWYEHISSADFATLGSDKSKLAMANFYILDNHTYIAEIDLDTPTPQYGEGVAQVVKTQVYQNTWHTTDNTVVFDGLGTATALTYNGKAALDLVINDDVADSEFNQTELYLQPGEGDHAPAQLESKCQ